MYGYTTLLTGIKLESDHQTLFHVKPKIFTLLFLSFLFLMKVTPFTGGAIGVFSALLTG